MKNNRIPILMYHQITPDISPEMANWAITPETFASQMRILKLFGFKTITLEEFDLYMKGGITIPKKSVIITFDDGYQETIDYSLPALKSNDFNAVYFVPIECIGNQSKWLLSEFGLQFPIIDWETVLSLDSSGFQIGSHSMTHPYLDSLSSDECYNELHQSRLVLEERLSHPSPYLAYPFGSYNESVRTVTRQAGYIMAFTDQSSLANRDGDPLTIPRINIGSYDKLADFVMKIHTACGLWSYTYIKMMGLSRLVKRNLRIS